MCGRTQYFAGVPVPLAELAGGIPTIGEVAASITLTGADRSTGNAMGSGRNSRGYLYADRPSSGLRFQLLAGDIKKSLTEPNNMLLSRPRIKYFVLAYGNGRTLK